CAQGSAGGWSPYYFDYW
nr:immunoglobulin heavy chain junction region [Macaca mulatta]MOW98567.1 immunoglobulin heavy chain junction region [Macaca mulatta]MOW98607.1 immunoglobulin heavy chain junction region [Macaca mulatta]MOX00742.1 immunoglobulin heavy chain junction region [Macaca mulatta]MOX01742.1 immunoglobulin heavy chain junction region [Macaca mulatta]